MNNWGKFAEILGLELEQEFVLTKPDGKRKDWYTYEITEEGIFYKSKISDGWLRDETGLVEELLNRCVKAVAKPWKPKNEEKHWYYSDVWEEATCINWYGSFLNLLLWKTGNCFRTKEEASTKGKEIMDQIKKEYDEA